MMEFLPGRKSGDLFGKWKINSEYILEKTPGLGTYTDKELIKEQLQYVLHVAKTFDEHIQSEDNVNTVQYYLRICTDHCYDLLALVPQSIFFNENSFIKLKDLNLRMKEWCGNNGYQVALIIAPWVKNVESLHLNQDGYVLIYDAA